MQQRHIGFCDSADGTRIAFQTYGDRSRHALLYVGPWHASLEEPDESSRHFWDALSTHRFGVTFDRRGTGASGRDVHSVNIQRQCADVVALLDHLGLQRADVLAHADGVPVAIEFAKSHADRTRRVMCVDANPGASDLIAGRTMDAMRNLVLANPTIGIRAWIDTVWPDADGSARTAILRRMRRHAAVDVITQYFEQTLWDLSDASSSVQAPALIIQSTPTPPVFLRAARELAAAIPGARFATADRRDDKASPLEQLERLIIDFLSEDERPARHRRASRRPAPP